MYSFANPPNVSTSPGAFLDDWVTAVGDCALRFPRQVSGIDELQRWVAAQRQALLSTVLVSVEDGPRARVLSGHP